jgi:hypothetical protein
LINKLKKMRRYLLFIWADYTNENSLRKTMDFIREITATEFIRYKCHGNSLWVHFSSEKGHERIWSELENVLSTIGVMEVFLTEYSDKTTVRMKNWELEQFLNLGNPIANDVNYRHEEVIATPLQEDELKGNPLYELLVGLLTNNEGFEDCDDEGDDESYKKTKNKPKNTYNLDEILEKIKRDGTDTLTDGEKAFLKSV